ncbi:hypothetical protein DDZ18_03150 [Marinicauda salina]|uniref:DUF4402 domain-containing protein n=1 Tax=Marinicauda salina TaxID=2135793 RepID=A0A2U2BX77_9PROT|nr:hypothetical protein [Marinicauda salina]PWE18615.1 hypothetical protein DDZ18_03150 [Marinicauda salina]
MTMLRNLAVAALVVAALPTAGPAAAAEPALLSARTDGAIGFDPFEGRAGLGEIHVRIDPGDADGRTALIAFEPADGGRFALQGPGGELAFEIDLPTTAGSDGGLVPTGSVLLSAGDEATFSATIVVPGHQYADPGLYARRLDVVARDPASGAELSRYEDVVVEARVPSRAQVNIAGASGAFDFASSVPFIDFGRLETGEQRRVFVQVRANALTEITVSSEHGGVLAHDAQPALHSVPYAINLDGERSTLEVPLRIARRPARSLAGTSYPLSITIGEVAGRPSGVYRDYLLVEVRPQ